MEQEQEQENHSKIKRRKKTETQKTTSFCINDHADVLLEVLKRVDDARALGAAACVCRLWSGVARNDAVWEHLCFRHCAPPPPPSVRALVVSLGGYRRLYMMCVEPALSSLRFGRRGGGEWTSHGVQLSLSLFCVEYYERLGLATGGAAIRSDASTASLMFLCSPVNV